jgi:hypothetical protein
MVRITLDSSVAQQLIPLTEDAELCDPDGNVIGYYTRVAPRSAYDGIEIPISEEELDRRSREPGGRALDEILRDLKGGS